MRRLLFLFSICLLASCQKKVDDNNAVTPPGDSTTHNPYPDTTYYAGSIHAKNSLNGVCIPYGGFDSTYSTTLAVYYPDSFHVNFHLEFWDRKPSNDCNFPWYIHMQDNSFGKNDVGMYLESSRHYHTNYTLRNDSLIIDRAEGSDGADYHRTLTFGGKKQ